MNTTYLLLGSNLGDREKYLRNALELIETRLGKIHARSSLYQTASWGKHNQPDFINQAIQLETPLYPEDLLTGIHAIERELGRQRIEKWSSRTIDIDILLYGDKVIKETNLTIPHPYLHERRFGLMPLCEIAPDTKDPVSGKTIQELLIDLSDDLFVKKLS